MSLSDATTALTLGLRGKTAVNDRNRTLLAEQKGDVSINVGLSNLEDTGSPVPPVDLDPLTVVDDAQYLVLLCYKNGAPQKGQPTSCRSTARDRVWRRVAMDPRVMPLHAHGANPEDGTEAGFRGRVTLCFTLAT